MTQNFTPRDYQRAIMAHIAYEMGVTDQRVRQIRKELSDDRSKGRE